VIKRATAGILAFAAAVIVVSLVAGWALVRPIQAVIGKPPEELHAVPVAFPSDSGATLHGWWSPVATSGPAVLLLPGVRANRLSMVARAEFLKQAGYSVLLIDFQATGETAGSHITFGWLERRDVVAAVAFIRSRQPGGPIAIIGSSLGGAAALLAMPALHVNALVLEAVYPTVERATENRLHNYFGPFGPAASSLLLLQLPLRLGVSARQLRPVDHIASTNCPVLVINGLDDRRTTPDDARLLYSRARPPKQLWMVAHAGHVDLHRAAGADYETRVLSFLSSALARR
jgi:fermentation-respiration switch protein FrsA (DUF1100 family)